MPILGLMEAESEQKAAKPADKNGALPKVLYIGGAVVVLVGAAVGMYMWQNKHVKVLQTQVSTLNKRVTDLTKSNDTLVDENKRLTEKIEDAEETTGIEIEADPAPAAIPSKLTITSAKLVPTSTYSSYPQQYPNYLQYEFTIKNNSDKVQTYYLSGGDENHILGVSKSGQIVKPQIPIPSAIWTGATLAAGGSVTGASANFWESDQIVKLLWKAPDATAEVEIAVPALE
jgi:hypothetical protein